MLPELKKNLVRFLAMLLLLQPVNSFSLGLGEVNLHSALNQPLDADIGLLSVGSTDIEDIEIQLASKEDFDNAGIDRLFFLTKFKFKVLKHENGEAYLKITSHEPVKEPFLDFIIKASWPNGRLLREYTLLLDPPVLVDERPAALDIPLFEEGGAVSPSQEETAAGRKVEGSVKKVPPRRDLTPFMPRASDVSRSESGGITYGPVKTTDTLWSIASQMRRGNSVTVQQIMIALLKENPEAFDNNNINALKAGYFLRISDESIISDISAGEAEKIAKLHYEQWIDARHAMAVAVGQRPLGVHGSAIADGGAGKAEARLKLMAPDEAASGAGSGSSLSASGGDMRQELAFALESADISRQENEELRNRLSALEEQLQSMQRLITLKDDTLSVMQVTPEELAAAETSLQDSMLLPDAVERMEEPLAQENSDLNDGSMVEGEVVAGDLQPTNETPKVTSPVAIPPSQPVETSIVDDILVAVGGLLGGIDPLIALGGLAVIGLLGGMAVVRRRKQAAMEEEISGLDLASGDVLAEGGDTGAVSDEAVESVLNDVIPEYSGSGAMDVTDDDEIDAIAEADVYLAYRRFDKAEELLIEAVQNDPDRHELQLKLLEVYATGENKDAFIARAETLQASLGGTDNNIWKSVVTMGQKIAPTSLLFNEDANAIVDSTGVSDELDIDLPDLEGDLDLESLDLDSFASSSTESKNVSDNPFADVSDALDEAGLNDPFDALDDLSELEGSLDSAMDLVSDNEPDSFSNLGLDEGNKEKSDSDDVLADASDTVTLNEDSLEFTENDNLNLEETAKTLSFTSDESSLDDELKFEDNLSSDDVLELDSIDKADGDLSDALLTAEVEQAPEPRLDTDEKVDDIEDDLFAGLDDSDTSKALAGDDDWLTDLGNDIGSLDGDLGDIDDSELFSAEDEVGTKLDLARAYIDMGDHESAKGILDEVVADGNDEQKKDALELIEQAS